MPLKKLKQWAPVSAKWLARHRAELLRQGFEKRELQVLEWRDVDGLTFTQIGQMLDLSATRPHQIYHRVRRKLSHPMRARIVAARYRVNPKARPRLTR